MNEPTNESQPTPNQTQPAQTNQHKPALAGMCRVCGGECRIQATMCDKCENTLRGWIHDYPIWIHALREFLRRGSAGRDGLDDLARRVRARRRELLDRHNLDGTLDEVKRRLGL